MTRRLQRGATAPTQPFWLRVMALACLLLVTVASSAQVTHVHGKLLPNQATQVDAAVDASQLPGSEASCPLCVAMHSALPAVVDLQPLQLVAVACTPVLAAERSYSAPWHFAMFSRPPPVVGL